MKVAIIQYSTYGHITTLAKAVKEGVLETGLASQVDLFQVPETLPEDVLQLMHAPEKPKDIPVATIEVFENYDAFLFGIPTRYGSAPSQWIEFWGQTGGLWAKGALSGKPAGIFVSTGTPGGGQETTVRNSLNYLTHHGMPYIPLGFPATEMFNVEEFHGGSPWGAGTYAGADGSRQPNEIELIVATTQGQTFAKSAIKIYNSTHSHQADVEVAGNETPDEKQTQEKVVTTDESTKDVKETTKPVSETTNKRATQSTKTVTPDEKSSCRCVIV
jgi:NAD(P)H dehydrogenase (quinone)